MPSGHQIFRVEGRNVGSLKSTFWPSPLPELLTAAPYFDSSALGLQVVACTSNVEKGWGDKTSDAVFVDCAKRQKAG